METQTGHAKCKCTEYEWVYLPGGYTVQAAGAETMVTMPEDAWVRYEPAEDDADSRYHIWLAPPGAYLYCDGCGTKLNAIGTIEETFDAADRNMWKAAAELLAANLDAECNPAEEKSLEWACMTVMARG